MVPSFETSPGARSPLRRKTRDLSITHPPKRDFRAGVTEWLPLMCHVTALVVCDLLRMRSVIFLACGRARRRHPQQLDGCRDPQPLGPVRPCS